MTSILSFLLSLLLIYKYWVLFFVLLLSGIILPVPVSSLLLATGAFISQGYFNFYFSLLAIVSGNILGDCFDFFLAKKYGRKALNIMHIGVPKYFEKLEHFVNKYPGSAIFLTRFVGTIEPLTSLLCGFAGIKFRKFIFYDFIGNIVSNGIIIYVGYVLGIHWQDFLGFFNITSYILIGIVTIIILFIITLGKKHIRNKNKKPE